MTACSTSISGTGETKVYRSPQGVAVVDTFEATAMVTAINPQTRKLALRMENGRRKNVRCGPEVVNFDQIKVGDQIDLVVIDAYAIFLDPDASQGARGLSALALAPVGGKPGAATVDTVQVTATIKAIDRTTRKVTLEFPDGKVETVEADPRSDLSDVAAGKKVTIEHTQAVAVAVGTP